jgi:hypothetical protein
LYRAGLKSDKAKEKGAIFESVQEKKTMDDYGTVLGRMACMFVRGINLANEDDYEAHGLSSAQREKVRTLKLGLLEGVDDDEMDKRFHAMLTALFFKSNTHHLMDELDCPVQRFLVYASVERGAHGFISVREIGRLIAKLLYSIRCCVFNEVSSRSGPNIIDRELGGLMVYASDMLQTPFGFLTETMHLAASVAGEAGGLPQVSWLGLESGQALAIHGKRVELRQIKKLCKSLMKKAKKQLDLVKRGMKTMDWSRFDPEDDLTETKAGYSFVTAPNNATVKDKLRLLHSFMVNGDTQQFFTKGKHGTRILWRADACRKWLKQCKGLLETFAVLCHVLGGQPARGTEFTTLRWRNSVDEDRGVYWVNQTIMLLATYSKTRSITRRNKLIPRQLPFP